MKRLIIAIGLGICVAGPAYAQQCLHGSDETPEQQARRRQAVTAARVVNTIQANQPGSAAKKYLRHDELAASSGSKQRDSLPSFNFAPGQDVLPGWELKLEVTEDGYWFMIKDKTDPCGFAYVSNARGVIYGAEPIR